MSRIVIPTLLSSLVLLANVTQAKTVKLTPADDWFTVLSGPTLSPGDEIELSTGVYSDARRLAISQQGKPGHPIVIRAANNAQVRFKRPDGRQNTINLEGCQYFILRGIEITGGAAAIRMGRRAAHQAKHITLEDLHIHHIGGVAITANNPGEIYEHLVLRRNHIHHTSGHGEAFYLGSNNAADGSTNGYIFDSIIENNYIHHLNGPQISQGDGIELKDGSYNNIVRDNVIHDTNYPGIIVYGTDGKSANIIERNVIWNSGDHGIQAAADAIIRNNLISESKGDGIHCRNHQSAVVGNLQILHNTIFSKSAVRIVAPESFSGSVVVANNAVSGLLRIPQSPRVVTAANLEGVEELFPGPGSKCLGVAKAEFVPDDDFNGTPRDNTRDVGAYRHSASGNPGWKVQPGFKPRSQE